MQIETSGAVTSLELPFNPSFTFDCGQTFRWRPVDLDRNVWVGTVGEYVLEVSQNNVKLISQTRDKNNASGNFIEFVQKYFSHCDKLEEIYSSFPEDPFLEDAINRSYGLKILTQDPWECLISFVCSINKNIPSIKTIIRNLSLRFGRAIVKDSDGSFHTFPRPTDLARATEKELLETGIGFRWRYIKFIAEKVSSGELDLESLRALDFNQARNHLISRISRKTFGVGPKVADCTLLFSLHKTEAFPIDVWIRRCVVKNYSNLFVSQSNQTKIAHLTYEKMSTSMRERFGKYAGYAQQYMYMSMLTERRIIRGKAPA